MWWWWMYVTIGLMSAQSVNAVPDIDNPTLEGALNEEGYDKIIKLTTEASGAMCEPFPLALGSSVLIKPADHLPRGVLACTKDSGDRLRRTRIIFTSHVTIINTDVTLMDFMVADRMVITFVNCTFTNTDIRYKIPRVDSVHLQFVNTKFSGHVNSTCIGRPGCSTTSSISTRSESVTLWFKNCTFLQTAILIKADYADKIQIESCTFSNDESIVSIHGGLYITVKGTTSGQPATYTIRDSMIEKQIFRNPIISALNLHYSVIMLEVKNQSSVTVNITGCTFRQNERVLQFRGFPQTINIVNCSFIGNEAIHNGPAILSEVGADTEILIKDSLFRNNMAGSYKLRQNMPEEGVVMDRRHITFNTSYAQGLIRLDGSGGAISLKSGKMTIEHSRFINNTGLVGSSVYSHRGTVLRIRDSYLEGSLHWKWSGMNILYSMGETSITKTIFNATAAENRASRAVVEHFGSAWSMKIYDIYIACPLGYNVITHNTSKYIVQPYDGIQRSFAVDYIMYWCDPCTYTSRYEGSDFGYYNYSIGNKSMDKAHYTLIFKRNIPEEIDKNTYWCLLNGGEGACADVFIDQHDVQCKRAKKRSSRTGQGQGGPSSYYWKYKKGRKSVVSDCPSGYCASDETCAANRTGTLCGQCISGFSQAYFTAQCIQDDQCKPAIFWITYILMGVAYVLFLIALAWLTLWVSKERSRSVQDQTMTFSNPNAEIEPETNAAEVTGENSTPTENGNEDTAELTGEDPATSGSDKGFPILDVIIILVYYCQDSQLFHKANDYSISKTFHEVMNSILSLVARFNWEIFSMGANFCVVKGATAVVNQVVAMVETPKIILISGIVLSVWHLVIQIKRSSYRSENESRSEQIRQLLLHGLFLTLLLAYQGHVLETAASLKCVPFEGECILFIEGTIVCTQPWQYILYLYLSLWLAPFFLILVFGSHLLIGEEISIAKFILFCLVPLPAFLYLVIQILVSRIRGIPAMSKFPKPEAQDVIGRFFQNSQKELPVLLDYLCCHGVIVMFRFAMVMMYTCSYDVMNGMVGMLLVVFFKLVYTSLALPYSTLRSNWLSVAGDAAVLVVGGTNLVAGIIRRADTHRRHFKKTEKVLKSTEAVLLVWLPICVAAVALITIVVKRCK